MNTVKIGWIGLGTMGTPMSQQLIKAGYPVTVYNRSKEKEAGYSTAESPASLLVTSDVVFVMVSDDAAIRDIFQSGNGLLQADTTGKLVINMSTVSPGISREMAAICVQKGNQYLDAPVSGSLKQAQDAALVIMAGGEQPAFETAQPILQHMGKLVLHLGPVGSGNMAKLTVNLLLSFYAQGLAESVLFAKEHGVKTEDLLTVIANSALGNVFSKIKGDAILQDNYKAAFAVKHIAKDLRLAKEEGWHTPMAEVAWKTFQQAETKYSQEDIIAVIKQLS